jgi:hypothetical protein
VCWTTLTSSLGAILTPKQREILIKEHGTWMRFLDHHGLKDYLPEDVDKGVKILRDLERSSSPGRRRRIRSGATREPWLAPQDHEGWTPRGKERERKLREHPSHRGRKM